MDNTRLSGRLPFLLASLGLLFGAAVHLFAYRAGPAGMAWLGAPPSVVTSRAAGSWPALIGTLIPVAALAGLAILCWIPARTRVRRIALGALAFLFVLRGLLVLPYWAGLRDLRTPFGHFVLLGDAFVPGSLVVLAIGLMVAGGLLGTRPPDLTSSRADPSGRPTR
ncbi:hypothetical protein [Sphingomonas elodea]|uniref:hypothetical protein n=1 Tax=Sphingomonas elodea TaxID=179878 RepID=UPI0002F64952|nr:hypothetical protein [Sphingomonas elodea]